MADKGYGNFGRLHKSRTQNSEFPYLDDDNHENVDDDLDDKIKKRVKNKTNSSVGKSDFMATRDKFYFVAGNTKLSDCFVNPGKVLVEVISYARMFNPVPALGKGKKTVGGSSFPNGVGNFRVGDSIIGKNEEIASVCEILCRRTKNNPANNEIAFSYICGNPEY